MLDTFFATCPQLLFVAGADGHIQRTSNSLDRLMGEGSDAGLTLSDLVHPEDREALQEAWARMQEGGAPLHVEVRLRDAQGGYQRLSCDAARSPDGAVVQGGFQPIPVEERHRLRGLFLDTMVEHVPAVVWALDSSGTFLYHDGKLLESLGLRRGHFVGGNVWDIYKDGSVEVANHLRRALTGEVAHYFSESRGIHWENWIIPIPHVHEGQEAPLPVLGFSIDVSRARNAEDALLERLAKIEQQQEIIRQLSTPIIEVWDGVLTLPMFGILDSMRTAEVMDSLLDRITSSRARFAILDMTGVEVVDTGVAGYLIQLVGAIRLLGAEGIVSGIRTSVAQTMITLGADLSQIITHRNLRAALASCIKAMRRDRRSAD
ncbi:PAS domain-containing protein [Chondromyces apiculatus]|uniref:RsbR, positive regulator of sigma-B n=1 Tax=Chondromyces apiculatus DSM 436 TaxID=1192034 RepID=A0A017TB80_9BACT|nr:PAS domain-containing protein [Chondromyces apiculatus]EYF06172.1 RsbR, positive regulator of sigma-B [Chondromyces apiculatus DSM 436]